MNRINFKRLKNLGLIISLVLITLTGCKYSEEELKQRDEYIEEAENRIDKYLELKYGDIEYKIEEIKALKVASGGPVPDFTPPFSGVVLIRTDKGKVYIDTKTVDLYDSCSDNFEEKEIKENLLSELDYHLPFNIANIELEYGTDNCTNKKLCNGVFDIIDDASIIIEVIDEDISNINVEALRNKLGYSIKFDIINYRNEKTYKNKGAVKDIGNSKNILLYSSTYEISTKLIEYKQYNIDKQYNFYVVTDNNSSVKLTKIKNNDYIKEEVNNEIKELYGNRKVKTDIYKLDAYINSPIALYVNKKELNSNNGMIYLFELTNDNEINHIITANSFKICNEQYIGELLNSYTIKGNIYVTFIEMD